MFNSFLARVDGISTPPVGVAWPTFDSLPMTVLRKTLLGETLYRQHRFLKAVQLVKLVEESSFIDHITQDDARVTYTAAQLTRLLSSVGLAVQSTGASTTSVLNVQFDSPTDYADWTVYTSDGLTYRVTSDLGQAVSTITFDGSGKSGLITTPDSRTRLFITGGQPSAHTAWSVSYWNPQLPYATQLVTSLSPDELRPYVRADLLAAFDNAPQLTDKIAAAIVTLGRA